MAVNVSSQTPRASEDPSCVQIVGGYVPLHHAALFPGTGELFAGKRRTLDPGFQHAEDTGGGAARPEAAFKALRHRASNEPQPLSLFTSSLSH